MDNRDEMLKQFKNNPIEFIEYMMKRKLRLYEKIYFNIQFKIRSKYNVGYNFLWCISQIWDDLE